MKKCIAYLLMVTLTLPLFISFIDGGTTMDNANIKSMQEDITTEQERTYRNPFNVEEQWSQGTTVYGIGDPFIMRHNGMYYLYASTQDRRPGIRAWYSENMVDWKYGGYCVPAETTPNPVSAGAYAPEVFYWNGYFYLYSATPGGQLHRTYRATDPLGPFVRMSDTHPNDVHAIDGSIYIDDDENATKYFTHSGSPSIVYRYMNDDMLTAKPGRWSLPNLSFDNRWTEGTYIFKRNGKYYVTYTGNHILSHNYRIKYAVGDSVLTMKDPRNALILCNSEEDFDGVVGLGHNSIVGAPDLDSRYVVYHSLVSGMPERRFNIDRLIFNGEKMEVQGPTWWDMPAPKMPEFYDRMDSDDINDDNWDTILGTNTVEDNFMSLEKGSFVLSKQNTPDDYTAEFNMAITGFTPNPTVIADAGVVVSYTDDDNNAYVYIDPNGNTINLTTTENGIKSDESAKLPSEYSGMHQNEAVRKITVKKQADTFDIYVDDRLLLTSKSELDGGKIGLKANASSAKYAFTAFSSTVNGNEDKDTVKPTNSDMYAVHANETSRNFTTAVHNEPATTAFAALNSDYVKDITVNDSLTFNIQPKEKSYYSANIMAKNTANAKVNLYVDDTLVKENVVIPASGEFLITAERYLLIDKTSKQFTIKVTEGTLDIYSVKLAKLADIYDGEKEVVQNNIDFEWIEGAWNESNDIISSNASNAWAKAGYGTEYWGDYEVSTDITFRNGNDAGLMLRMKYATVASDNVMGIGDCINPDYHYGYYVFLTNSGVTLGKQKFNWQSIATTNRAIVSGTSYNLKARAEGANIKVYLNNELIIDYTDKDFPIMEGKVGLRTHRATAEYSNFTVKHLNVPETPANSLITIDDEATAFTKNNLALFTHFRSHHAPGKGYFLRRGGITFNESNSSVKGYLKDTELINGTVSCDMTLSSEGRFGAGIIVRGIASSFTHARDEMDGLAVQLERAEGRDITVAVHSWKDRTFAGTIARETIRNFFPAHLAKTANLKVELKDDKLDVYLDNALVLENVDISDFGTVTSRSRIGVRSNNSTLTTITNFKYEVKEVTNPILPEKVAAVTSNIESRGITSGTAITLSTTTSGAVIKYSLDNETTWLNYTAPITINTFPTTIIAYAEKEDFTDSDKTSFTYTEKVTNVTANPTSRAIISGTTVALSTTTPDAQIKYSLDNEVTWNDYTNPIPITVFPATLSAYATKENAEISDKTSFNYTEIIPPTPTRKLTFDRNFSGGGASFTRDINSQNNRVVNFPSDPTRSGWRFAGWYTARTTGGIRITSTSAIPTNTTTVYARWVRITHRVRFMDGSKVLHIRTVNQGDSVRRPATRKKSGYTFIGWYTNRTGGKTFNFSTKIAKNTDVYARYEKNPVVPKNFRVTKQGTKKARLRWNRQAGMRIEIQKRNGTKWQTIIATKAGASSWTSKNLKKGNHSYRLIARKTILGKIVRSKNTTAKTVNIK